MSMTQSTPLIDNPSPLPVATNIPGATYRFQFHKGFTFNDAIALVPYLAKLGISHCYASPILKARPGSTHGYDIVNHQQLNPEVGDGNSFDTLCQALKNHGIGLIVDIVPNHMGVGHDNDWWVDVLENGPASEFNNYFDIDWKPLKKELWGKILLPVLGEQYGQVLENGEFSIRFAADCGRFYLGYYQHSWPLSPNSYPHLLRLAAEESQGSQKVASQAAHLDNSSLLELQSIITAFENLPEGIHLKRDALETRWREKKIALKRLADLCAKSPALIRLIEAQAKRFNEAAKQADFAKLKSFHELLERQCYRLAFWRVASDEINYRRFFDINELAGLNIQNQDVFEKTHALLFKWVEEKKVSGFRIDHPDGLYDPAKYFVNLQEKAAASFKPDQWRRDQLPLYVVAEKILAQHENLPEDWPIHGTSGYEFGNRLNGLFVMQSSEVAFNRIYEKFSGRSEAFAKQVYDCKQLILKESLSSELNVLANRLYQLSEQDWKTRDFTLNNLRRALAEIIAAFPVYRTYIRPQTEQKEPDRKDKDQVSRKDKDYIQWAVQLAKKHSPLVDTSIFDFIHRLLLLEFDPGASEDFKNNATHFVMKFQQLSGPVMAKGLEDTCFYRYNRLASLNEVGGEPQHFGLSPQAFHRQTQEQFKSFPHTMLNTSTHDSKRSEDVRARINVLSEIPDLWEKQLERWTRLNRLKKSSLSQKPVDIELTPDEELAPDKNDEYLLYQTLLGVWPFLELEDENQDHVLGQEKLNTLKERVGQYMIKACREAKVNTSWLNPNTDYENALLKFIDALLAYDDSADGNNNTFLDDFCEFSKGVSALGVLNSLSQTLIKLTVPGVPDIYQGSERWGFNLVDPDNRRPVDYQALASLSEALPLDEASEPERVDFLRQCIQTYETGLIKFYLSAACLRYRKQHERLLRDGGYLPLTVENSDTEEAEDCIVAFARQLKPDADNPANRILITVAPRLCYSLMSKSGVSSQDCLPSKQEMLKILQNDVLWKGLILKLPQDIGAQNCHNDAGSNLVTGTSASDEDTRRLARNILSGRTFAVYGDSIPLGEIFRDAPLGLLEIQL
ncbi:MAG: malto-oligosyltrehalose synthase [Vampirovibrionales bacterium]|nr:malto-oligosyltrehalose synthase [Vampirovibrionales bacterium]